MSKGVLDVAIVGAGISGVYSGWQLKKLNGALDVKVFEASDRIGGRLLSVAPPGIPNMVAELGGMRILPAVQPRIAKLIETLNEGAPPDELIETYVFPVDQPENISYLRGTHLRLSDFQEDPRKVPYRLTFQEFGKIPGEIVLNAIEQIVPGITNPSLNEYQRQELTRTASFAGKKLSEQGFWQVLVRVLSGEAYQLALDAGGYQSTLNNWNAADAIPWYLSDFGVDPEYQGFRKGFQQVPLTVARRFQELGGGIELNKQVSHFESGQGESTLHFSDGSSVRARVLILAMPRRALDLIRDKSPLLCREDVTGLIRSVTPQPLFKLFATYDAPWWLPAGVKAGRTTTDLPVRQTYYWPAHDGQPVTRGPAMLMASYDDGLNIGFWDGFRPRRGVGWRPGVQPVEREGFWFNEATGRKPEHQGGAPGESWFDYDAPLDMVREVQRQLVLVHGLAFAPKVQQAAFMDWGDDPYGGGWNSWNIGVDSWDVKERILQPDRSAQVYICGEAYSHAQGWVEGALETADLMLGKLRRLSLISGA